MLQYDTLIWLMIRFIRGKPGHQTGFDIDDSDLLEMEQCHGVVVASAIFGIDTSQMMNYCIPFYCLFGL